MRPRWVLTGKCSRWNCTTSSDFQVWSLSLSHSFVFHYVSLYRYSSLSLFVCLPICLFFSLSLLLSTPLHSTTFHFLPSPFPPCYHNYYWYSHYHHPLLSLLLLSLHLNCRGRATDAFFARYSAAEGDTCPLRRCHLDNTFYVQVSYIMDPFTLTLLFISVTVNVIIAKIKVSHIISVIKNRIPELM